MVSFRNMLTKDNFKKFFIGCWEILVLLAYAKFYIFCLTTMGIVLMLSVFVLEAHGADVTVLAASIKPAMYSGISFVCIILLDKIFKDFGRKK